MSWYLTFNEDLPNWATFLMAFVSPDEPSNLRNTGPVDDAPELGLYSTQLPKARAEALLRIVDGAGVAGLVNPAPVAPETPTLTVGKGDRKVPGPPKLYGFDLPTLPSAMVPVREALRQLVKELRAHPLHVVRGEAAWTEATFKPKGTIELLLTLKNPGPAPVELLSPDGEALVILTIGKSSGEDVEQVQLTKKEVTRVDPTGKKLPPSDVVTLGPGEEAQFKLQRKVYLTTGSYRGTVTLRMKDEDGSPPERAYGVLLVKAGGFEVKGWW